jgi:hypothetical protein
MVALPPSVDGPGNELLQWANHSTVAMLKPPRFVGDLSSRRLRPESSKAAAERIGSRLRMQQNLRSDKLFFS